MSGSRRPRILVLSFRWPPTGYAFRALEGVAQQGIDVCVGVTLRPGQPAPTHEHIELFELPRWARPALGRTLAATRSTAGALGRRVNPVRAVRTISASDGRGGRAFVRSLYEALPVLGRHPDVVHHEWANEPADQPWRRTVFGVPSVISCRGLQTMVDPYDPARPRYRTELGRSLAGADRVHCVSDFMAAEAESLGARAESIRVIRPAVDLSVFTPRPSRPPTSPVRLLCVASLRWVKGIEHLLLAVAELRRRGRRVRLDVVGEGPRERERLEAAIADLGLADVVTLAGRTDRTGVVEALRQADIVMQSSVTEGLPNSLVEAMAVGVPVVATAVGGVPELIDDGVEGLLVPPRDPAALADAVERLLDDGGLRERLVTAARDRVTGDFRLEDQVAAWVELYTELAALHPRSTVVPSVVDPATGRAEIAGERSNGPLIVAVGPFGWQGGHDIVLEAAADLVGRGCEFSMVLTGSGVATGEAGFLRHDLGLEGCVDLRVGLDRDARARLATRADLLVHLPRVPGVGGDEVAGLLGSGQPVVTTDSTGVDGARTGVRLVPARDPAAAADAIAGILGPLGRALPSTRAP